MLEGVVYTSVFVSDQDRALDFYTNVLGFAPRRSFSPMKGSNASRMVRRGRRFASVSELSKAPHLRDQPDERSPPDPDVTRSVG